MGGRRSCALLGAALALGLTGCPPNELFLAPSPDGGDGGTTDGGERRDAHAGRHDAGQDAGAKTDASSDGATGCSASTQCPPGQACDPTTGACGASCAGGLVCNGGCCDGRLQT